MKQVAPYPKTPTGLTLISTELLGKTPERDIAAAPTKVHLKALLGDSIHKVLNLCTYNHNRDMSQATGTTMLSKFVDCFLVCKTAFKEVIENHWTILCDLSYSKCITLLEMILKKNHCAPARFLDKIIPGVHSALASMPCKVWKSRNDNTGLKSSLLPITNSPLLTLLLSVWPLL